MSKKQQYTGLEIAVIGMSCNFPGAKNIGEFWKNIKSGKESIKFFSEEEILQSGVKKSLVEKDNYVKAGVEEIEDKYGFDPQFFGYTIDEAMLLDPQTRLMHQTVYNALLDAGCPPLSYNGKTGLYLGSARNQTWEILSQLSGLTSKVGEWSASHFTNKDFGPTLISHNLNLRGPSISLDTGCSTSLVAIHMAVRALLLGECDMAVAGGCTVTIDEEKGYVYEEGFISSKDGHCRAFDEQANGTLFGDGVGMVVLKKLDKAVQDGDHIYATIKGSAINNDGDRKGAYTAPSIQGQVEVIKNALSFGKVEPNTVGYVETHGTGTNLGDPIEFTALRKAFTTKRKNFCHLGAVKCNVGHLDTAAGVAGFIKTVLTLKHKFIPPLTNFTKPNPSLDVENSPFVISSTGGDWKSNDIRRAGVSSFGIGGTNAHIVLEEYVEEDETRTLNTSNKKLIPISAKSQNSLNTMKSELQDFIKQNPVATIEDIAYSLKIGRDDLPYRSVVIVESKEELQDCLEKDNFKNGIVSPKDEKIVFAFPGQGTQYVNMGKELYEENELFKNAIDQCFTILKRITGIEFKEIIFSEPGDEQIHQTINSQPILFTFQYAMTKVLNSWGIQPDAMIGHSIGEYVAACISGVFTLEDALYIVSKRAAFMQQMEEGDMLAVQAGEEELLTLIPEELCFGSINGPNNCVLSGTKKDIGEFAKTLKNKGFGCRVLSTSHAFHSDMMEQAAKLLTSEMNNISLNEPRIPFISNVSGDWISKNQAISKEYWGDQLRKTVQMEKGIAKLLSFDDTIIIEVGPRNSLEGFIKNNSKYELKHKIHHLLKHPKAQKGTETTFLHEKIGDLWLSGISFDWPELSGKKSGKKIPIPGYCFDNKEFKLSTKLYTDFLEGRSISDIEKKNEIEDWFYAPTWKKSIQQPTFVNRDKRWLVVGFDHKVNDGIARQLSNKNEEVFILNLGESSKASKNPKICYIDSNDPVEYADFLKRLDEPISLSVIDTSFIGTNDDDDLVNLKAYKHLLYFAKGMSQFAKVSKVFWNCITQNEFDVIGSEKVEPQNSILGSALNVISQELFYVKSKWIDLDGARLFDEQVVTLIEESETSDDQSKVAYRNEARWVYSFEQIHLSEPVENNPVTIKKDKVYLIVGGLGTVGTELAKYLCEQNAKVAIIGKTDLNATKPNIEVKSKLVNLEKLKEINPNVLYISADISCQDDLKVAIDTIENRFETIHGVFHLAAAPVNVDSNYLIPNLKIEDALKHFEPKVNGIQNIKSILKEDSLDFTILFSSLSTVLGGVGYFGYAAANSYLDSIAKIYDNPKSTRWISLNWDAFFDADDTTNNDTDKSISKKEASKVFKILPRISNTPQIVISVTDLDRRLSKWVKKDKEDVVENKESLVLTPLLDSPIISDNIEKPKNEEENRLLVIWKDLFGYKEIGVTDDFFELGGDSLKALQLINAIRVEFQKEITLENFFKAPNIRSVAQLFEDSQTLSQIPIAEPKSHYALSSAQKRLYFLSRLEGPSLTYNISNVLRLEGELDNEKIKDVFHNLVTRHEVLRTTIEIHEDVPMQVIHESNKFEVVELEAKEQEIDQVIASFIRPFDIEKEFPIRIGLVRVSSTCHFLIVDLNHICTDAVSLNIFMNDFKKLYTNEKVSKIGLQYKDYSEWQNTSEQQNVILKQKEFWLTEFEDEVPVLDLPLDYKRPLAPTSNGKIFKFSLDKETTRKIRKVADQEGVTVYMFLLAIYNVLLAKLGNTKDVVVGTPVLGRDHPALDQIMGMFVNTLAIRNQIKEKVTFDSFLQDVKEKTIHCFNNQNFQYEDLINEIQFSRQTNRNPLFDAFFSFENMNTSDFQLPGLDISGHEPGYATSKFDLSLTIFDSPDQLTCTFEYKTDLFKEITISNFAKYFDNIISRVVENVKLPYGAIDIIGNEERNQLLYDFNDNQVTYNEKETILDLFSRQVLKHPDSIAIEYDSISLTYKELDQRSNQLAHYLCSNHGVKEDDPILILMDRSELFLISMLGVWKASGAYVPIDPSLPVDRISYIAKTTNANVIITDESHLSEEVEHFLTSEDVKIIANKDVYSDFPDSKLSNVINPDSLSYIIFTSGSTGNPKGAMVEHKGMLNHLYSKLDVLEVDHKCVIAQNASQSFDISVWQFVTALLVGGKTIVYAKDVILNPLEFAKKLHKDGVNILEVVPSYLSVLLTQEESGDLPEETFSNLKYLMVTGETLPSSFSNRWLALHQNVPIINAYGPTEASDDITHYVITEPYEGITPIGTPIRNMSIYILDEEHKLCPKGTKGELCVSGVGVGRGYIGNAEKTSKVFLEDPFRPGEKMYKTGDLAKYRPNGVIEFLGRNDFQVKINGHRIELEEISAQLEKNDGILQSLVVTQGETDNPYLVCYYTGDKEFSTSSLENFLSERLPEYMVPKVYMYLSSFPLTNNGKIDRKLLPSIEYDTNTIYETPARETEKTLIKIWGDILGIDESKIGITHNFFNLGGHSLSAILLVNKVKKILSVELSIQDVFNFQDIRSLATYIESLDQKAYLQISKASFKSDYVLSSAQKRMYFLYSFDKSSLSYNMPSVFRLGSAVDVSRLESSIKDLVLRHESLRTYFRFNQDDVYQVIGDGFDFSLTHYNSSESDLDSVIASFIRPFDLEHEYGFRSGLIRIDEGGYLLLFDMHHIISDGLSHDILYSDLLLLYQGLSLSDLSFQYKDYSEWQQSVSYQQKVSSHKSYWLDVYSEGFTVLDLPYDYPRPLDKDTRGGSIDFELGSDVFSGIKSLSEACGVTVYMILLSFYKILLSKLSNQEDIIVGTPTSGRHDSDLEGIVGMFVNTLALRSTPKGDQSYGSYLSDLKDMVISSFDHELYQYEDLVDALSIDRDTSRNPLFDVMFSYFKQEGSGKEDTSPLSIGSYEGFSGEEVSKFDLGLVATEHSDGLRFTLSYAKSLFHSDTIERFITYFHRIVEDVVSDPSILLKDIDLLSSFERKELLEDFNATTVDYDQATVLDLFAARVKDDGSAIALELGATQLTYSELDSRSNQLARYLESQGVVQGSVVGLYMDRSIDMIVGILGVLKLGGIYLPINPSQPVSRTLYMLSDSGCLHLLVNRSVSSEISDCCSVYDLSFEGVLSGVDNSDLSHKVSPEDSAYIIYTSGSTGMPKGVLVAHGSVFNFIRHQVSYFGIDDSDRVLQFSPIYFDASVEQIWISLTSGCRLVLIDSARILDEGLFRSYLLEKEITHLHSTPSFLMSLELPSDLPLRRVVSGGEACSVGLAQKYAKHYRFYNKYGPTETTVSCLENELTIELLDKKITPIGRPISNTYVYVLGKEGELLPKGVSGELYIGGKGLSKGYLNRPELTEDRFVANPFRPGEQMYRTGDVVRWLSDGTMLFLGRNDDQVKIRGYRIELGEIVSSIESHSSISQALVLSQGDGGNKYLVCYYVSSSVLSDRSIIDHLSLDLPDYMIPKVYVALDQFPLTSNGKIDKRSLPSAEYTSGDSYVAPVSEQEHNMVSIWSEVLGISTDKIGVEDNFFTIGGHSLSAISLINKINKAFSVEVSLRDLFRHQDIGSLLAHISTLSSSNFVALSKASFKSDYVLSSAQKRMYFLYSFDKSSLSYNMPSVFRLGSAVDVSRLESSIKDLVLRHESLRTYFRFNQDDVYQVIGDGFDFSLTHYNSSESDLDGVIASFIRPFDLEHEYGFRSGLIRIDEGGYLLLFDMHHIISDGLSHDILYSDLLLLYQGLSLSDLSFQYKDYSEWQQSVSYQQKVSSHKSYWLDVYSEGFTVLDLPYDYPRPLDKDTRGGSIDFELDAALVSGIRSLSQDNGATMYMTLLSFYKILLSKLSNQEDIIVGTPTSGRHDSDLEGIVGMFVNTLALRSTPKGDQSYGSYLSDLKDMVISSFDHEMYQYEDLVDALNLERDTSRNPLFDVMFSYFKEGGVVSEESLPIAIEAYEGSSGEEISKFDMDMTVTETEASLFFSINYDTSLFKISTIERFISYFQRIVNGIVSNADILLKDIDILESSERYELLEELNATTVVYEEGVTVLDLFNTQVVANGDKIALELGDQSMSYQELDARSNQLARYLEEQGVIKGSSVPICVSRSFDMIVGILGILKSGCNYVPIDPEYPMERKLYILDDIDWEVCLVNSNELSFQGGLTINLAAIDYKNLSANSFSINSKSEDLAYIIYTSGSTGKPKGVMITHHCLYDYVLTFKDYFKVTSEDKILQQSSISFDTSIEEIFPVLISGGSLVLSEEKRDFDNLLLDCQKHKVTLLSTNPYLLGYLNDHIHLYDLSLRVIISGGDTLKNNGIKHLIENYKVYNTYGPTESTVCTTYYEINELREMLPIGRPIANRYVYVLDAHGSLLPKGVSGELYIGGKGLSKGYLNRPELTEDRFVANPFRPGEQMYRTGDVVRWLSDGNLAFMGRNDDQVKIRGYRIELGEIVSQLECHEAISQALVLSKGDGGNKYLVCYYVSSSVLSSNAIIAHLSLDLPDYMIPKVYVALDQFPLTSNGKIDKRSLPSAEYTSGDSYVAPVSEQEHNMVSIWSEVLGISTDKIGVEDNFFTIGGHSLSAISLINKINKAFSVEVSLRDLFRHQDIGSLLAHISTLSSSNFVALSKASSKSNYVLSSAQKRMYFLYSFDKSSLSYNMPSVFRLGSAVDVSRLESSIKDLVLRHESLRTYFRFNQDDVYQVIGDGFDFSLTHYNSSESDLDGVIASFIRPFDLEHEYGFRSGLIRIDEGGYLLLFDMHHIISDGLSHDILYSDLLLLYQGLSLSDLSFQYKDYSEWQQSVSYQQKVSSHKSYWLDVYSEGFRVLDLPYDYPRPLDKDTRGGSIDFELDAALVSGIRSLSQDNGATMYMTLLSFYKILLSKLSNQEDIIVGTPTSGRHDSDLEGIVGMFVNTLALRSTPKGDQSYGSYLSDLKDMVISSFDHELYQYEDLVDALSIDRDTSRNPLFDVMFSYFKQEGSGKEDTSPLSIGSYEGFSGEEVSKFDLGLVATEHSDGLRFTLSYAKSLFHSDTIERFITYFHRIVEDVVSDPGILLKDIDLLSSFERKELLEDFNATTVDYDQATVLDLFAARVKKKPNQNAIVYKGKQITYKELDQYSKELAQYLISNYNVSKGDNIGVKLERSEWLIITALSILRVGSVYVPIDLNYPEDRIEFIEKDSNSCLVIDQKFIEEFQQNRKHIKNTVYKKPSLQNSDLAYIIYTSGTTGKPKGVMVTHGNLSNLCLWHIDEYNVTHSSKGALFSGIGFDASIWEIFPYLSAGASLYPINDEETRLEINKLKDFFEEFEITHSYLPTAICHELIHKNINFESDPIILTGGDALSFHNTPKFKLYNNYGPTENTVVTTSFNLSEDYDRSIPIGRPISNTYVYVLGKEGELLPKGVSGELYIGGKGLSKGYLNRPELTEDRFVANPFRPGEQMYRTGDVVRWLSDGNLAFMGRNDDQVKIRGYRIELGEIVSQLECHEAISQALVLSKGDGGNKYLVCYYVSSSVLSSNAIIAHLSLDLPDYMIPKVYVALDQFPLTSNGKIDKRSLPSAEYTSGDSYVAPVSEQEHNMVSIWSEVLGISADKIGVEDNFFTIGGHSLSAISLINKINKAFSVEVSLRDLFRHQDIGSLLAHISTLSSSNFVALSKASSKSNYVLSSAQKRMYFLYSFDKSSLSYNMPSVFRLGSAVDVSRLESSIKDLVLRHESLRTYFRFNQDDVYQVIGDGFDFSLTHYNSSESDLDGVIASFIRPFDLEHEYGFRSGLIRIDEGGYLLLFDMHHIISDGLSHDILYSDLLLLYQGLSLSDLSFQYKDYSEWQQSVSYQQKVSSHKSYWLDVYSEGFRVLDLPYDYPRPLDKDTRGGSIDFELDAALVSGIRSLSQDNGATMYMTLLSFYKILLSKLSNQEDIIVGTPTSGRHDSDLEGIVGMFVNTLALRSTPKGDQSYGSYLSDLKDMVISSFDHELYQYEDLVDALSIDRDTSRNPLFDVMFSYFKQEGSGKEDTSPLSIGSYEGFSGEEVSKFDLGLVATEHSDGLRFTLSYAKSLFHSDTIERFITYFHRIVEDVVSDPSILLKDIDLLSSFERKELLEDFNATTVDYDQATVLDLFAARVKDDGSAIALELGATQLTYSELDSRSNQLARYLESQGVVQGSVVGLYMDRSIDMIVGILGVLKLGGIYLPINPSQPVSRTLYMLSDSGCLHLLVNRSVSSEISDCCSVYDLSFEGVLSGVDNSDLSHKVSPEDSAYIIYTSGSTGMPKGVLVAHGSVFNFIRHQVSYFGIDDSDRVLQFSPIYFDASVEQIWISLTSGCRLVLIDSARILDEGLFRSYLLEKEITHLHSTPSFLMSLELPSDLPLRRVVSGGEACSVGLAQKYAKHYRFYNEYGPTETTVTSIEYEVTADTTSEGLLPIGQPISNTYVYVLGKEGELLPKGVSGELYIGGKGLSKGYLNRPELTEDRFVANPFRPGEQMYRTGDIVRWLSDGTMLFLGRNDDQVKIRGYRIELGEIVSSIESHSSISQALVLSQGDGGNKYLVCYYVSSSVLSDRSIIDHLSLDLPDYMIPKVYVALDQFPLTSNGKIDKRSLPSAEYTSGDSYVAPVSEQEHNMVSIWSEVLGISTDKIGVEDNFFTIGGHSLLLTNLAFRIEETFDRKLSISEIYRLPTIRNLTKLILENENTQKELDEEVVLLKNNVKNSKNAFFIHDGSGNAYGYLDIIKSIKNYNCYGFEYHVTNSKIETLDFKTLAAEYIAKIRVIQQSGPYTIIGWSAGGVLAYEITRQLEFLGQEVEKMIMIDSFFNFNGKPNAKKNSISKNIEFIKSISNKDINFNQSEISSVSELWNVFMETAEFKDIQKENILKLIPKHEKQMIPNIHNMDTKEIILAVNKIRLITQMMMNYSITTPIQASSKYIRANSSNIEADKLSEYISDLEVMTITGTHFSIMKNEKAAKLAEIIEN